MPLLSISVKNIRNLKDLEFKAAPGFNFFYGENGSGKTTVLEAISFLGLGRSFRSRKHQSLINHESDSLTVHGRLAGEIVGSIGVFRAKNSKANRTLSDGTSVLNTSTLAAQLPMRWIDTRSLELLGGPPALRRGFLDWYLFHVKHEFQAIYQKYHQSLKQRNALLRHDKMTTPRELKVWTERLSNYGESLHRLRLEFYQELNEILLLTVGVVDLKSDKHLRLRYLSGWDEKLTLEEALDSSREQDVKRGFTGLGPHKADVSFRIGNRDLAEILSRGQTKKFVYHLYLAQVEAVQRVSSKRVILLMDDFPAEIDAENREHICKVVESLDTQVFITGIEKKELLIGWSKTCRNQAQMFHVKHGRLEIDHHMTEK